MRRRTGEPLIVAGDPEALAAAVPGTEIEDGGDEEYRPAASGHRVAGDEDSERNDDELHGHALHEAPARDRVVRGAEVDLAQQEIGHAELAVAVPHEHERDHEQRGTTAGTDEPEVRPLREEPL